MRDELRRADPGEQGGLSRMTAPLYSIPGQRRRRRARDPRPPPPRSAQGAGGARTVAEVLAQSQVEAVLDELDRDLSASRRSRRASATSRRCW